MEKTKNKRTMILFGILVGLLIIAYKVIWAPADDVSIKTGDIGINSELTVEGRIEKLLTEIEGVDFNISIMDDKKFNSLQSIETPILSLPVGKKNPFAPIPGSN